MDTAEKFVLINTKRYRTNEMMVESQRIYFPDTHTMLESVVLSSDAKIPQPKPEIDFYA